MNNNTSKTNVIDYLTWRGDLTFLQDEFNEADNLVLCIIAYLNFGRFHEIKELNPNYAHTMHYYANEMNDSEDGQLGLSELSYLPVIKLAGNSKRFSDVKLFASEKVYDDDCAVQFQAISFLLPDNTIYCAFMGTDRSFAGWKEDFNLSYKKEVPSQLLAVNYVEQITSICKNKQIRIGGHSKGGNLAAYAAINLPEAIQEKVIAVYNNDGPGFNESVEKQEGYTRIKDRIHIFIPESSIVGVLLYHFENYTIIDSTYDSILQHEAMSWKVVGNHFVRLEKRSEMGTIADDTIKKWLDKLNDDDRRKFTEVFFDVVSAGGKIKSIDEFRAKGVHGVAEVIKHYNHMGADEKKLLQKVINELQKDFHKELIRNTEADLEKKLKSVKSKS